jgi:large subunit ribosomal protein L23
MEYSEDVIIEPIVSEESWRLQDEENKYTFRVHPGANKIQIRKAVENLFGVEVEKVWTMNYRGKPRSMRFNVEGKRPNWKKAVVKLVEGDQIEIYQ